MKNFHCKLISDLQYLTIKLNRRFQQKFDNFYYELLIMKLKFDKIIYNFKSLK